MLCQVSEQHAAGKSVPHNDRSDVFVVCGSTCFLDPHDSPSVLSDVDKGDAACRCFLAPTTGLGFLPRMWRDLLAQIMHRRQPRSQSRSKAL